MKDPREPGDDRSNPVPRLRPAARLLLALERTRDQGQNCVDDHGIDRDSEQKRRTGKIIYPRPSQENRGQSGKGAPVKPRIDRRAQEGQQVETCSDCTTSRLSNRLCEICVASYSPGSRKNQPGISMPTTRTALRRVYQGTARTSPSLSATSDGQPGSTMRPN
jgi:hypothetical protein